MHAECEPYEAGRPPSSICLQLHINADALSSFTPQDTHFPPEERLQIIAEPGRYFAEHNATLGCRVNGIRLSAASVRGFTGILLCQ